ncbi:YHYH protein [Flavicella sediminum]|uniref:YHYH protein n=1 Tax=Flavicella sediminum TaxID=2585141 RepID=UPI001121D218|nr:YHYH protein [Flavicella sediminum]
MKLPVQRFKKLKSSIFIACLFCVISCSTNAQSDDNIEDPIEEEEIIEEETEETTDAKYDISSILAIYDNLSSVSYSISGTTVTFTTSNLPNHKSPYYKDTEWHDDLYEDYTGSNSSFRLNPNRIDEQDITLSIPLHPKKATSLTQTPMGPIGISRNGVVFFNQYAAGRADLDGEINSFDQFLGHPTGTSMYHYHIEPTFLTDTFGEDALLGLLSDGFPVYGPKEGNETITSSDLDEYHGHFGATKEFPKGIYHYHVTADAPYINGDGFYGTPGTVAR